MRSQPSIFPLAMANSWSITLCPTTGTTSGSSLGVTTAPLASLTLDGMPPSGHLPGWWSHQKPSTLSKDWFSM